MLANQHGVDDGAIGSILASLLNNATIALIERLLTVVSANLTRCKSDHARCGAKYRERLAQYRLRTMVWIGVIFVLSAQVVKPPTRTIIHG